MIILDIKIIESTKRPKVFMTRANLMKHFDIGKSSVDKRIREIREEIEKGRYSEKSLIVDGGIVRVNYYVFEDYMFNRQKLLEPNLRKHVEPFSAYEWRKEEGEVR